MILRHCGPFTSEMMTLQQRVMIGSSDRVVDFEHEIFWAQESESTVYLMHGGKLVSSKSTFNDWYGFMTSASAAQKQAEDCVRFYGITETSSLAVEVRTIVYSVPLIRTSRCEPSDLSDTSKRHQFERIPPNWFHTVDGQRANLDKIVISDTITWSTRP